MLYDDQSTQAGDSPDQLEFQIRCAQKLTLPC